MISLHMHLTMSCPKLWQARKATWKIWMSWFILFLVTRDFGFEWFWLALVCWLFYCHARPMASLRVWHNIVYTLYITCSMFDWDPQLLASSGKLKNRKKRMVISCPKITACNVGGQHPRRKWLPRGRPCRTCRRDANSCMKHVVIMVVACLP